MCYKFKICTLLFVLFISNLSFSSGQKDQDYVFEIFGNKYSYKEIEKLDRAFFFDLEKKKYEKINQIAQELFLKEFWKKKAQSLSTTADKASLEYMKEKVTVTDKEIEHTLKQFKNHPKIKQLSDKDQKIQIKNYLISSKRSKEIEEIIKNGLSSKNLKQNFLF